MSEPHEAKPMAPAASITTRLRVEGMDCASCATKIQNALQRMPGISEVNVSVTGGTVTVRRDLNGVDDDTIRDQISNLGYEVARSETYKNDVQGKGEESPPAQHDDVHSHLEEAFGRHWWQTRKGQLTIASGGALAVAFAVGKAVPATELWAFLLAMMVGLIPIAKRAISAAMAGTPFSIEMLMTTAAAGAVFIGATEEAATVVFLFLIGELLEGVGEPGARQHPGLDQANTEDRPTGGRWPSPRGASRCAFSRGHDPGASRRPDPGGRRHRVRREFDRRGAGHRRKHARPEGPRREPVCRHRQWRRTAQRASDRRSGR